MLERWPLKTALETALADVERALANDPSSTEGSYLRACILRDLGRHDEARRAFAELYAAHPEHAQALNELGVLASLAGLRHQARALFEEAVCRFPDAAAAHVNLANALVLDEPDRALTHYLRALELDAALQPAHQGLCGYYAQRGDAQRARHHRRLGYCANATALLAYYGEAMPVPALVLLSTDGGNFAYEPLLDNRTFQVRTLYVEAWDDNAPLPQHRVILNGIADPDRAPDASVRAQRIADASTRPVLNSASAVAKTGRLQLARLHGIPNVAVARVASFARSALLGPEAQRLLESAGLRFPLLLRSPGHHMGRHFELAAGASHVQRIVEELPGESLLAFEYLDTRDSDGAFRKYRVMIVDGQLYPLHLAISKDWKVHYFSSPMAEHAEYRAEEERFLSDMPAALGPAAIETLFEISRELALDYAGIDFTIHGGKLVVFEATPAMSVLTPGPESIWDYRRKPVERVLRAMRAMSLERAAAR